MKLIQRLTALLCALLITAGLLPSAYAQTLEVDLISDYAYIIDADTGEVLMENSADEQIYPASMTKMMTVMVALEHLQNRDETVVITDEMLEGLAEANASVAGFSAGDEPTVTDLLYAAALPSGADACQALAVTTAGSVDSFVAMMNEKAQQIGMTHTHFVNTTGLDDENHYSTCRDISLLLQYCLNNADFAEIFSTASYVTTTGMTLRSNIFSTIAEYGYDVPGYTGGKSGFTYEAGHCLAYWASLNSMNIIAVTARAGYDMYSPDHITDADTVLCELEGWDRYTLITEGTEVHTVTVHNTFSEDTITVTAPETKIEDLPQYGDISVTVTLPDEVKSGLEEYTVTGDLTVTMGDHTVYTTGLMVTVPREPNFFARLWLRFTGLFTG